MQRIPGGLVLKAHRFVSLNSRLVSNNDERRRFQIQVLVFNVNLGFESGLKCGRGKDKAVRFARLGHSCLYYETKRRDVESFMSDLRAQDLQNEWLAAVCTAPHRHYAALSTHRPCKASRTRR